MTRVLTESFVMVKSLSIMCLGPKIKNSLENSATSFNAMTIKIHQTDRQQLALTAACRAAPTLLSTTHHVVSLTRGKHMSGVSAPAGLLRSAGTVVGAGTNKLCHTHDL